MVREKSNPANLESHLRAGGDFPERLLDIREPLVGELTDEFQSDVQVFWIGPARLGVRPPEFANKACEPLAQLRTGGAWPL